ncbi:MAG TPA: urease accessory UreF family protein, partial [Beijerinckiaceae bacterium]|nr:urease accessory UreF family protein [Beijerinckiaceae bacterium]
MNADPEPIDTEKSCEQESSSESLLDPLLFHEGLLFVWLSPSFPVGAFAYSHGLEWSFEAGDIEGFEKLGAWLRGLLRYGSLRNDAILLASAWRAVVDRDASALRAANDLVLALAPSQERYIETTAQGNAFAVAARAAWPSAALDQIFGDDFGDVAYPIAVAATAASHDISLPATLESFLIAFVSNLVSAALRLGCIGQTDGQKLIAALMKEVSTAAVFAVGSTLDDLGG